MKRWFYACLIAACGGSSSSSHSPDAAHPSDAHGSGDTPAAATGYKLDTIPANCEAVTSPQVLTLDFVGATDPASLPTAVSFFGAQRTRFSMLEHGQLLLFDSQTSDITIDDAAQIPTAAEPNGFIAPLWTFHLRYVTNRSELDEQLQADHVVFQWKDFALGQVVADQMSHITIQAKLFNDGRIELHYCTLNPGATTNHDEAGASASIGIESPDGARGVSVGFHQQLVSTASAYRFTPQ
jgi:hypothetical protein